jgi:hypothetical protein
MMSSKPILGNANNQALAMAAEPEVAAEEGFEGGRGGMLLLHVCTRS